MALIPEHIRGVVKDSITGEALPFATIYLKDYRHPFVSEEDGTFVIPSSVGRNGLTIKMTGYADKQYRPNENDSLQVILLRPVQIELDEVVVKPKREKYSKKNNPAVDFVNRLRKESRKHDPTNNDYYSYDLYEKTILGVNDFKGNFDKGLLSKGGKFLSEYVDTSSVTGKRILDLMLKEKVSTKLYSESGKTDKEVIRGYRSHGVDEVANQESMRVALEDAVREIDVFSDNITLLQNRFVSPLSAIGPDFYKYYLTDTVVVGEDKCLELSFVPHNPESMGFNGKIYVPVGDTTMFVKKITMRSPSSINMNLVDNIFINLSFEKDSLGNRHKTYDDVCIEMSLIPQAPKLYGRKTTVYRNFSYKKREDLDNYYQILGDSFLVEEAENRNSGFWNAERMVRMSYAERKMDDLMAEARKRPFLYWSEKALKILVGGYVSIVKPGKIDLGPVNTFVSANTVEGVRLKVGGMTMAPLNPHVFGRGYVAFGTKDKKWKYNAEIEYSFAPKKNHSYEWPRHGFFGHYRYDVDMLGQHYLFTNADNIFLSLKRKESILATYRRQAEVGYILELRNHFSVEGKIKHSIQEATSWVPFVFSDGRKDRHFTEAGIEFTLRWAPGEKFVQGRNSRSPVNMDGWIFQFTHMYGPKGFLGAAFTNNRSELSIQKRLWFSAFGFTDIILKGGIVWDAVYYPALMWPNANLSYTIQPESYSLMNTMEFANDKYCSLDLSYYGLGILFNHVPLIKKLKLREVITFKGLMGGLSRKNNPEYNKDIYEFPEFAQSRVMGKTPYMEIGAGIDNILMFLRVDYVWRLTYRDTPGCSKSGLRVSLHFSF
ncbi:MAG: DUF5686 and carboxypeptidase regulatory-like domain-containing protein [Muribaculaceae bacterium]|nr:DUF5686 and carboxypeptidase regulatory-like domain-containing protein [Muribaculaceae bacterium]